MIEDPEEANRGAELRKAEARMNLNVFATGVLGEDAVKFHEGVRTVHRAKSPCGLRRRSKPAAEVRPLIEDLAAGETVPTD